MYWQELQAGNLVLAHMPQQAYVNLLTILTTTDVPCRPYFTSLLSSGDYEAKQVANESIVTANLGQLVLM
jgi:hypothetical protein